jgi:hypothetical protein
MGGRGHFGKSEQGTRRSVTQKRVLVLRSSQNYVMRKWGHLEVIECLLYRGRYGDTGHEWEEADTLGSY